MDIIRTIEIIGFPIGVLALILGVVHLHELRAQAKQIHGQANDLRSQAELSKQHGDMLDAILRTQSTHHEGPFPDYIKYIAELIEKARKEIIILCDFPAYGSFSAHHDFVRYRQAIERKIDEGIPVKITCLDAVSRVKLIHEQFSREEQMWEAWKVDPQNKDRLQTFVLSHTDKISPESLSPEQFATLVEDEDIQTLTTYKGADVVLTEHYIPFYFWIVDGNRAVFAIPTFSSEAMEHGFSTLDPHLIDGFKGIMARYCR